MKARKTSPRVKPTSWPKFLEMLCFTMMLTAMFTNGMR